MSGKCNAAPATIRGRSRTSVDIVWLLQTTPLLQVECKIRHESQLASAWCSCWSAALDHYTALAIYSVTVNTLYTHAGTTLGTQAAAMAVYTTSGRASVYDLEVL